MRVLQPDGGTIEVAGLAADTLDAWRAHSAEAWRTVLQVTLIDASNPFPQRPLRGTYTLSDDVIEFRPRFPLAAGQRYNVRFDPSRILRSASQSPLERVVAVPAPQAAAPAVAEIFPTASVLPENLLKFHLYFSTPVGDGELPERVYLTDDKGNRIEGALLTPVHELWDSARQRLTLLLDPSRVKTGLIAHDELGRALTSGTTVRLVVEAGWRDLAGTQATERFVRTFSVSSEDRQSPQLATWSVDAPRSGSLQPVVVRFPEPLDQACLVTFLRVLDQAGQVVAGDIDISNHEQAWIFTPRAAWTGAPYRIAVDPRLEDLAGNNLMESFDHVVGTGSVDGRVRLIPFMPVADGTKVASVLTQAGLD